MGNISDGVPSFFPKGTQLPHTYRRSAHLWKYSSATFGRFRLRNEKNGDGTAEGRCRAQCLTLTNRWSGTEVGLCQHKQRRGRGIVLVKAASINYDSTGISKSSRPWRKRTRGLCRGLPARWLDTESGPGLEGLAICVSKPVIRVGVFY